MRIISYILAFIAGAALVYFWGRSKEAEAIKADNTKMVVTVTIEAQTKIDSLLSENLLAERKIEVLSNSLRRETDKVNNLLIRENALENDLLKFYEKIQTYDYSGYYSTSDSAARWLIDYTN